MLGFLPIQLVGVPFADLFSGVIQKIEHCLEHSRKLNHIKRLELLDIFFELFREKGNVGLLFLFVFLPFFLVFILNYKFLPFLFLLGRGNELMSKFLESELSSLESMGFLIKRFFSLLGF